LNPRASLDDVEKIKFLTLPGLELRTLGRPARSQSLYRLSYPDSHCREDNYETVCERKKCDKYGHCSTVFHYALGDELSDFIQACDSVTLRLSISFLRKTAYSTCNRGALVESGRYLPRDCGIRQS
jgi:hypothetical protein